MVFIPTGKLMIAEKIRQYTFVDKLPDSIWLFRLLDF